MFDHYDKREDYFCPLDIFAPWQIPRLVRESLVSWRDIFNADSNYPVLITGPLNEAHGMTCILKYAPNGKDVPLELSRGRIVVQTFRYKEFERHINLFFLVESFPIVWFWEVTRELKWKLRRDLDLELMGEYA